MVRLVGYVMAGFEVFRLFRGLGGEQMLEAEGGPFERSQRPVQWNQQVSATRPSEIYSSLTTGYFRGWKGHIYLIIIQKYVYLGKIESRVL